MLPIEELSLADFQKVMDINVTGAFLFTREAIKVFKKQTPPGGPFIRTFHAMHAISVPHALRLITTRSRSYH